MIRNSTAKTDTNDLNITDHVKREEFYLKRLEIWLTFGKWMCCSAALAWATFIISAHQKQLSLQMDLQEREQKYLTLFMDDATNGPLEKRVVFVEFVATLTSSPELRQRWESYRKLIYDKFNAAELELKISKAKISKLEQDLASLLATGQRRQDSLGADQKIEADLTLRSRQVNALNNAAYGPSEQKKIASNAPSSIGLAAVNCAIREQKAGAKEEGGQNRGSFVRKYMRGDEGEAFAWQVGFISWCLEQTNKNPFQYTVSTDDLATQALNKGLLFDSQSGYVPVSGDIMLIRRTPTDWVHAGFVIDSKDGVITTIEGNTNDDGSREGHEVAIRSRSITGKDFIHIPE